MEGIMERKEFLEKVESFLGITQMAPTAFGISALKDPNFVRTLRAGRESRESVRNRVLDFINNYK